MTIPGWLVYGTASLGGGALLYVARQLWQRWRERIVDHLDQLLRRKVTRFDRRYREFMLSSLRFIDVKGLATVGFYTPELDEVFVDVSLAYRAPGQIGESVLAEPPAEVTDRHSINEFLDRPKPVVLAMIGVPGSGKTTLLRHTARMVCRHRRGRRRRVPILLYLRDHVGKIVSNPNVGLSALVLDTLGRYRSDEPPGWFEQRLRDGDCVVLLDGLDEVARQKYRSKVADWVSAQTRQYPRNDFVITSRPQGYRSAGVDGAVVVQVRSFTDEQVTRFVRDWYLAIERHSTGQTGGDVEQRAGAAADDLLKRLAVNPGLYDLTVNPLLLTMIANVHRFRGALPGSRTDLYSEICQAILSRRQEAKNLPIELSGERKEALLRGLAFTMMRRQVRDMPRAAIYREVKPALRRLSARLTEKDLLADLGSNGLLIEREADLFSFAHLTFQEYLAASYIRDKGLVKVLADSVDDVWWRETTLLYASRSDADPIVAACLSSGSVTALSLAFGIAEQGGDLAPELRKRLDKLIDSAADDTVRQRLWASVLAARHLRDQIRTDAGGRVYARPISTVIYQSFVLDTGIPQPDGPGGRPNEPVTGVRGSDATAFVRWINEITGGEPGYRLPTRAEISDPAVQRALGRTPTLTVWLEPTDGSGPPELWIPAFSDHPHTIDAELLARHVHADIEQSKATLARLLLLQSRVTARVLDIFEEYRLTEGDLARTRVLDRALAPTRTIDRTLALNRDRTSAIDINDRDINYDWGSHLLLAYERALTLAHELAAVRTGDLIPAPRNINRAVISNLAQIEAEVMGGALARALTRTVRTTPAARALPGAFADAFIDEAHVAGASWVVSLDELVDGIRQSPELLSLADPTPTTWAYEVAGQLREIALPVVTRQQPLTAGIATAIRIAALCLAAEADGHGANPIGDKYREIAAGITLLQRRIEGEAPATETIMLTTA